MPAISPLPPYDPLRAVNASPGQLVRGSGPVLAAATYLLYGDQDLAADGTLWHCWNLLGTLCEPTHPFARGLWQYGVRSIAYGGWGVLPDLGARTSYQALAEAAASIPGSVGAFPILITRAADDGLCSTFCAWHSTDTAGRPFAYCPLPSCPACYPWGDPLSGLTRVLTHELAEALTDPRADGSGWAFPGGAEADDVTPCVWANPPATVQVAGFTYQYQQYWSNAVGGCGG